MSLVSFAFGQTSNREKLLDVAVQVPSVIGRSKLVGHADPAQVLHVAISLSLPNSAAAQAFADSVSNPKSPTYRQFITPQEFGQRFGQPASKVQAVTDYLKSKGFKITLVADNNLNILADCTVAQAEKAFDTTINKYHALSAKEPGRQDFYSYAEPIKLPATVSPSVLDVAGLENFTKPVSKALTMTQTRTLYNAAPIYNSGMRGEGRTIAISNFDGFRLSNLPLFYRAYGLPTPTGGVGSNVSVIKVDGGAGTGFPSGEGDLDIQMVLGMAPLCNFQIYDGASGLIPVLTREAQDNTADIISESWGWILSTSQATAAHNLHVQMSAQGITYMEASGDYGTSLEPYSYSNYEPEVLQVGGTIATVNGSGQRATEVAWSGSGGGWSIVNVPFNKRPSWQVGTGVPTNIDFRLNPDISLNAAGNGTGAYEFYLDGALETFGIGTSYASPVFAGQLAIAQQKLIGRGGLPPNAAGKRRMGRIQDLIYSQNGRSDVYFDITSGANGKLPNGQDSMATTGWDFVTGFGAMNIDAFVNSIVIVPPVGVSALNAAVFSNLGRSPSGSAAALAKDDGNYYSVSSISQSGVGTVAAAEMTFQLTVAPSKLTSLTLALDINGPKVATNYVYLYNYKTGTYDLASASSLTGSDAKVTYQFKDMTNYVSSTNQVRVVTRAVYPTRLGGQPFTLKVDQAILEETF